MTAYVVGRPGDPALPELLDLVRRNDVEHVLVDADRTRWSRCSAPTAWGACACRSCSPRAAA